ncbi:hypothetical protein G8759_27420 [Spirosoma aureum]|uniref:Type II toxin-antitoxin system RelE/ParE family toxin n=1 Tax=Spirosoma aureum TaxID=2692134 RepID=A0A6G9AUM2_9BACT|nr:hypothetical protein [Spirosoma aureum]QIP16100.1 hypothetical protein G8759_27420 [Spirosoma aureum]
MQSIFDFYAAYSNSLADRIVSRIVDRVDLLKKGFLEIGQIEPLLFDHPGKPRYLLEGYHKRIYRIIDSQHVLILTVFDVRQDPGRLTERFE